MCYGRRILSVVAAAILAAVEPWRPARQTNGTSSEPQTFGVPHDVVIVTSSPGGLSS